MSHYSLDELIELWKREKLTTEQMIGQILQVLREQDERLRAVAWRLPPGGAAPPPPTEPPRRKA